MIQKMTELPALWFVLFGFFFQVWSLKKRNKKR